MVDFKIKGAIFDLDDTLLDNKPDSASQGLHERSRLAAVHAVGKKHGIKVLTEMSVEDNIEAFRSAAFHTIESAVWNMFLRAGLVATEDVDKGHPLFIEIVTLKQRLHEEILLNDAEEVAGASNFLHKLAGNGLQDKLAIASSATRRDVDMFIRKMSWKSYFPSDRIKTKEDVEHTKPNPEVFNIAFDSLNLPESDRALVYAFEDDPRGIMSAKAAGLYVCAITTRFNKEELMSLEFPPDLVADSYEEFSELLGLNN
jgi:beta-phosphoglucomutase-like phosphatase (HAD superfamily)